MCVRFTSKLKTMKKKRIVYKVVFFDAIQNRLESLYVPLCRSSQIGAEKGTALIYKIGEMITSLFSCSFGIYCYCNKDDALWESLITQNSVVLGLECPIGTRYRLGYNNLRQKTINVEQAFIKEEV